MDTAALYQKIISVIQKSFIDRAEKYGLTVNELKGLDPSIEDLILHLKGLNAILKVVAGDDHIEIILSIDASQCIVVMERMAQAIRQEDQKEIESLMLELKKHAKY
ncbi:hypothetical protein MS2017_0180 [Bathymodiolus thermophilus thioautotrophic gill symbiont]|uniref:Uncharacterized protein n=1 Tax=Bathymodiolus thermophilus thioautotrophic gill symbiont TaxID=2360 RepID=A0A3G3IJC2_9GAMM|nr:hypothetical protein [Bathymodiolus thermophilus thioautotrophic gill symbiont]AYQ55935.1 hypothetical protein MS2017_0180 [Bathymodiolus thermophilus thioautotrophic gill symbiont]